MEKGSPSFSLNALDWRKIFKGLLIAVGGSVVAYLGQTATPALESVGLPVLIPVASTGLNLVLRWIQNHQS